MLGSAGAGGTGLYYGGQYMNGLSHNATKLLDHAKQDAENYYTFKVQKADKEGDVLDLAAYTNDIDFTHKNSFDVKVTASSRSNVSVDNASAGDTSIDSKSAVSCTFKFEVEGDAGNKTIRQDY